MMSHISKGEVHAYLDGALGTYSEDVAQHIREHLNICAECTQLLEVERRLRKEATAVLGASGQGPVELDPLEELFARAAAIGGQGQSKEAEASERTGKARPTLARRMYSLRWAATVVVSLGAGWMARTVAGPAGGVEGGLFLEPLAMEFAVEPSADQQPIERDIAASRLSEAEVPPESPSVVAGAFDNSRAAPLEAAVAVTAEVDEAETSLESPGAVTADVIGGGVAQDAGRSDADGRLDQVEAASARQRARSAAAPRVESTDGRASGLALERRAEPAFRADDLSSPAPALERPDATSQLADVGLEPPPAPMSSTTPFLVPGLRVRDVRLVQEADGPAGSPAGSPAAGAAPSVVVTQELGDGRIIELQFIPRAGREVVLEEAFQERNDLVGRTLPEGWSRAIRDVRGGLVVLSGPLSPTELEELLVRALGPR
jgi:hypothetical protein